MRVVFRFVKLLIPDGDSLEMGWSVDELIEEKFLLLLFYAKSWRRRQMDWVRKQFRLYAAKSFFFVMMKFYFTLIFMLLKNSTKAWISSIPIIHYEGFVSLSFIYTFTPFEKRCLVKRMCVLNHNERMFIVWFFVYLE